jgi:uncharacterized DUF497 family protein
MAALFEWDFEKDCANRLKHGVGFPEAQLAFLDRDRVIAEDDGHGYGEQRYFCLGVVSGRVMTVRFTLRGDVIRIIGAGYGRKGRRVYEATRGIHG